ncbi:MAG: hypothetical protein MJ227_03075 [Bacilli bacterium]|nr:hypothetical protein [Bacilli bacterium]
METLLIKRKNYEILEKMGERTYKVTRNGKIFFARYFPNKDSELADFVYIGKRLNASGVFIPKIRVVDKKSQYILMDFIEGPSVMEELIKGDLPESYYEQIYLTAWYAKANGIILSFKPEHFKKVGEKLCYLAFVFHKYEQKNDFTQHSVYLWFYTKDFINYLSEKGIKGNESRLKASYETTKQIALIACKYYR